MEKGWVCAGTARNSPIAQGHSDKVMKEERDKGKKHRGGATLLGFGAFPPGEGKASKQTQQLQVDNKAEG